MYIYIFIKSVIIAAIFSGKLFLVTDEKGVVIILMATEIEIVARY